MSTADVYREPESFSVSFKIIRLRFTTQTVKTNLGSAVLRRIDPTRFATQVDFLESTPKSSVMSRVMSKTNEPLCQCHVC